MTRSNLQQALYRARQEEVKASTLAHDLAQERAANARLIAELAALRIERRAA